MPIKPRSRRTLILGLLLLLAPAVLIWRVSEADHARVSPKISGSGAIADSAGHAPPPPGDPAATEASGTKSSASAKAPAKDRSVAPDPTLLTRFKAFRAALLAGGMSREDVIAALKELKQQVHDLSPDVAAATLIALLDAKEDAPTGLHFIVGQEGVLDEAPTYRIALLDLLGQTEPDAIIGYSRSLLAETSHPDEYAIGLRNLAWLNHEKALDAELVTAFTHLLDRTDWRAAPSSGYLESFDIAVAVGGADMLTQLVSVLRLTTPDGQVIEPAVNRAAFIALDRIMLREPDLIAGIYAADPTFMDFAPNHRASLLSRLDPASQGQAQALRTFLTSTPADAPELAYFGRIFPNGNYFDGNRLVTSWETPGSARVSERDARSLAFVNTLLADPAYGNAAPALQSIRTRLESFVDK